jgi:hypothetical protein
MAYLPQYGGEVVGDRPADRGREGLARLLQARQACALAPFGHCDQIIDRIDAELGANGAGNAPGFQIGGSDGQQQR